MSDKVQLGTEDNPFIIAPEDWSERGVPYGSLCKCSRCGLVARSLIIFDYYGEAGGKLTCETCSFGRPHSQEFEDKVMEAENEC